MIQTPLVRNGGDWYLPDRELVDGEMIPTGGHSFVAVHLRMLLQIAVDYAGLPDIRTLRASEIRFFYNGIRTSLEKGTAK